MDRSVGPWARERFGERAEHVRVAVAEGLRQALTDAQDAHKVGKSRKLFVFGTAQASRRYECIVEGLRDMDGVEIIKPKGSPHELVVVAGNLLYPFRYAKDDAVPIERARLRNRKISALIKELFEFFGPEPTNEQPSLFEDHASDADPPTRQPTLTRLPAGTRLVLVAYASNERAGVLNAWWGEAELTDRGHVRWLQGRYERLDLSLEAGGEGFGSGPTGPLGPIPVPRGSSTDVSRPEPRFDDGSMPAVAMTARPPFERANADVFPPNQEREAETPQADDQEQ